MSTGRVLGGALRLLQRRRVLGLGMIVALFGLVYAALYVGLTLYNPGALAELSQSLTAELPANWGAWAGGGAALLFVGGLWSEGGLILAAGRRAAGDLPGMAPRPTRSALARLPGLLLVGARVWWPLGLGLAVALAPTLYWALGSQEQTTDWAGAILGSLCCATLVFLIGWFVLWPQQRLANCALLLDGQAPWAAVRAARRLFFGRFGSVLGLWMALLLLNVGLLLVSVLLAALAAGLVYGLWLALGGTPENTALALTAVLAVVAGIGLLLWDGAVSAFNLNTWVLTYLDLRAVVGPPAPRDPALGNTQILGRQRMVD
jgi:hypothetical protein